MNLADVHRLYAYNDWANERILAAIARLPDEQFTRTIVSSYSSIRDTLAHIAFAEWLWLQRWLGESPPAPPEWAKESSFLVLQDQIRGTASRRRAYLDGLTSDKLGSTLHYRSTEGDLFTMPLDSLFTHCANHSTYHRGQLVTMLRQVNAVPPNTDYTQFVRTASAHV